MSSDIIITHWSVVNVVLVFNASAIARPPSAPRLLSLRLHTNKMSFKTMVRCNAHSVHVISWISQVIVESTPTLTESLVIYVRTPHHHHRHHKHHTNMHISSEHRDMHAIAIRYHSPECCQCGVGLQCVRNRTPSISAKLIVKKTVHQQYINIM